MNKITIIFMTFLCSCTVFFKKSETVVEGKVTNILNSQPIEGVELFIFERPSDPNWMVKTDSSGRFNLVIPDSIDVFDLAIGLINADGYMSSFRDLDDSKNYGISFESSYVFLIENRVNKLNIGLTPK